MPITTSEHIYLDYVYELDSRHKTDRNKPPLAKCVNSTQTVYHLQTNIFAAGTGKRSYYNLQIRFFDTRFSKISLGAKVTACAASFTLVNFAHCEKSNYAELLMRLNELNSNSYLPRYWVDPATGYLTASCTALVTDDDAYHECTWYLYEFGQCLLDVLKALEGIVTVTNSPLDVFGNFEGLDG